jgi:hypothetical protein
MSSTTVSCSANHWQPTSKQADNYPSALGLPRTVHDRLHLLHLEHGPLSIQCRDDVPPLQVPPVDLLVIDPSPYRKSIHTCMVDQSWYHTYQYHRVWRR